MRSLQGVRRVPCGTTDQSASLTAPCPCVLRMSNKVVWCPLRPMLVDISRLLEMSTKCSACAELVVVMYEN